MTTVPNEDEQAFIERKQDAFPPALWAIAQAFSILFHPLFIILYAFLLLAWSNPFLFGKASFGLVLEDPINISIFIRISFMLIVLPLFAILLMRGLHLISDIMVPDRQERIGPYIVVGLSYMVGFVQINELTSIPIHLKVFVLGATIGLFSAFFVNLFSKISIHAVGMGGFIGMVLMITLHSWVNNLYLLPLAVLLAGLVGTSRRILGAHEAVDIYFGYFIGFLAQFVALRFLYVPA